VGLWQRLGVRDEAEAIAMVGRAREVEGLPEAELAERMREWLARYDSWQSRAVPELPGVREGVPKRQVTTNGGEDESEVK
jgi:hypothetical protein